MTAARDDMEESNSEDVSMAANVMEENQSLRRKLEKTEKFNEDLRNQVETLSQELHLLRNSKPTVSTETQTCIDDYLNDDEDLVIQTDWLTDTANENMSIADCVKAAAEQAVQQTGFVYDETSGLYYDSSTGYYYDPENALYYNSATGTYYTYDQATQTYSFHSQVDLTQFSANDTEINSQDTASSKKKKNKNGEKSPKLKKCRLDGFGEEFNDGLSVEEGECSDSSDDSNSSDGSLSQSALKETKPAKTKKSRYPPCIRCMVTESKVETLPVGTLYIVTCSGATIGREKFNDIRIPDLQISKMHAQITYYTMHKHYGITDLGSQNGTLINGIRIAEPKQTSDPFPLKHEDVLQVGDVRMLLHIHSGMETCDNCEPGQVQAQVSTTQMKPTVDIMSKTEKEQQRRKELKQIRKKFGLESCDFEDGTNAKSEANYTDRASERRKTKGVDSLYGKTETASVDVAIRQDNKGRKLLEKMGWAEGTSLGKSQIGIVEPISVDLRQGKAGLGSHMSNAVSSIVSAAKQETWRKAKRRYEQLDDV